MINKNLQLKALIFHLILLILALYIHDQQTIDLYLQNFFYLGNKTWLVDGKEFWSKLIFYNGPKIFLGIFGVYHIFLFVKNLVQNQTMKRDSLHIILSLAAIPGIISLLKSTTGIPCPHQLKYFQGEFDFIPIFSFNRGEGHCFPGGHASGGFALVSLGHLATHKKNKLGLIIGLFLGWIMGLYQMMKGDHFFSHTLVSQEIAFLVSLFLFHLLNKNLDEKKI
jgi:membrane-associated PAP2 superfamily phosphatase